MLIIKNDLFLVWHNYRNVLELFLVYNLIKNTYVLSSPFGGFNKKYTSNFYYS